MKNFSLRPFLSCGLTLVCFIISLFLSAQPRSEYEARTKKAADEKALQKYIDDRIPKSTPKSYSSGVPVKNPLEILLEDWAAEKKAKKEGNKEVELSARDLEIKKYYADKEDKERRISIAKEESRMDILKNRDDFMARSVTDYKGYLSPIDNADLSRDIVYAWYNNVTRNKEQTKAIETFELEKDTAPFDQLLQGVNSLASHAEYATKAFNHLLVRFPEHKEEIERATLAAIPYYFGGRRPDVYRKDPKFYPDEAMFYPPSIYEEATAGEKNILLQRFKILAAKYPEAALKAAGKCRNQFNPFLLLAEQSEANEEECTAFHMKVFYSDYRSVTPEAGNKYFIKYEESFPWYETADQRMRSSVLYLMKYRRKQIQSLKKEDWIEIAKLQGLHLTNIVDVFSSPNRFNKDVKNYSSWSIVYKSLPVLWDAKQFVLNQASSPKK